MSFQENLTRHILVVDDNPDIHKDFQRIFSDESKTSEIDAMEAKVFGTAVEKPPQGMNYAMEFALQGKEAAEKALQAATSGRPFQLAFIDMRMPPGWDGLETIEQIWMIDPDMQMVICTAYSDYSWEEITERLGRTDNLLILKKPFDTAEVSQMASSLTEKWILRRKAAIKADELQRLVDVRTEEIARTNEMLRREIAVRHHAETSLRRTRFSLDRALDAIFWLDPEGRFVDVNETACKILGYPRKVLFTLRIGAVNAEMEAAQWFGHWRRVKKKGAVVEEAVYRTKDGDFFPAEVVSNFIEFGVREYNCVFVRDITRRKKAETQNRKMEEKIQESRKYESLGIMAAGIAHNFNNMLMAIIGNTELLQNELGPGSEAEQHMSKIQASAERASDLSKKMLAYSGHGHIWPKRIALPELILDIKSILESMTNIETSIEYRFEGDLPDVSGDSTQLKQAILNIVSNAVEAIGDGHGSISLVAGTTTCDTIVTEAFKTAENEPENCVYLDVTDSGCGMDEETVRKAFDPFFSTKFFGRGLGLAATSGIIRQHRGNLTVNSSPDDGAVFRILLPALSAEDNPEEFIKAAGDGEIFEKSMILVVDDEEDVRLVAEEMLEKAGFQALSASDGLEALKIFRDCYDKVGCVILDMIMPDMVGNETLLELRKIKSDVPIIISTRYSEQEVREMIGNVKIAGILFKPFEFAGLVEKVRLVLTGV
ncbi:MAG: response regulator [Desulfobacteraceae bacterium]|nr:response regulator [Desulfobacteraceae bacterium]